MRTSGYRPSTSARTTSGARYVRHAHVRRQIVAFDAEPLRHRIDRLIAPRHQGVAGRVRISKQPDHLPIGLIVWPESDLQTG